jgi:hypothetical protein
MTAEIGYRRRGDTTPMYHPERDFAYITPTLLRIAIEKLEDKNDARRTQWRTQNNITQPLIAKIVEALANAQADFVNAADPVATFTAALERHGFYKFGYDLQQYLFSSVGEVMLAAWFNAVREVSTVGEESPAAVDMAKFCATVREFCVENKLPMYDANYVAEFRSAQVRDMQFRLNTLQHEYAALNQRHQEFVAARPAGGCAASCCAAKKKKKKSGIFSRLFGLLKSK